MLAPPDLVHALKRVEGWVAGHHPDRLPFLRPSADEATLSRSEARLGRSLPSDIRVLYATHDGQPEGAPALYLNQRWLPLDLVTVAWEDLCQRYGVDPTGAIKRQTIGSFAVQTSSWSAHWLPLFGSPRGDHYCVDLRPERPDRYGCVLWFLHDRPERAVVAASLFELIQRVANGLETRTWGLDAGYDGLTD